MAIPRQAIPSSFRHYGVAGTVWSYRVGGYQVCDKWLKDRKHRRLDINEVRTYCRIVTALKKTIEIQQEIDELYLAVEDDLITWPN